MLARTPSRKGLTLFEVIIALMIFFVAVIPLWILVNFGTERALDVQQQAHASLLCQAKLAEVISGAQSLESTGLAPFPEDAAKDWQWQMDASQDVTGLWRVKVTVQRDRADGGVFQASLSQMVLDPSIRGSTLSGGGDSGSSGSSSADSSSSSSSSSAASNTAAAAGGKASSSGAKASSSGKMNSSSGKTTTSPALTTSSSATSSTPSASKGGGASGNTGNTAGKGGNNSTGKGGGKQ